VNRIDIGHGEHATGDRNEHLAEAAAGDAGDATLDQIPRACFCAASLKALDTAGVIEVSEVRLHRSGGGIPDQCRRSIDDDLPGHRIAGRCELHQKSAMRFHQITIELGAGAQAALNCQSDGRVKRGGRGCER
jgi:hypothetical protein